MNDRTGDDNSYTTANTCEHGHLARKCEVCELKAEVARLRSVCREAGKDVRTVSYWGIVDWDKVRSIAADLEQAGKEATDGQ